MTSNLLVKLSELVKLPEHLQYPNPPSEWTLKNNELLERFPLQLVRKSYPCYTDKPVLQVPLSLFILLIICKLWRQGSCLIYLLLGSA